MVFGFHMYKSLGSFITVVVYVRNALAVNEIASYHCAISMRYYIYLLCCNNLCIVSVSPPKVLAQHEERERERFLHASARQQV